MVLYQAINRAQKLVQGEGNFLLLRSSVNDQQTKAARPQRVYHRAHSEESCRGSISNYVMTETNIYTEALDDQDAASNLIFSEKPTFGCINDHPLCLTAAHAAAQRLRTRWRRPRQLSRAATLCSLRNGEIKYQSKFGAPL